MAKGSYYTKIISRQLAENKESKYLQFQYLNHNLSTTCQISIIHIEKYPDTQLIEAFVYSEACIDKGTRGHSGHMPPTFHKLLGQVPLCN